MTSRKTVLEIINDNSLILYYLLVNKKIDANILLEAIETRNKDLILDKIIPVSKKQIKLLENSYTKEKCFDEILYLTDNKYRHLKEIRYIVNMDEIISEIITDKIYHEKVKVYYTDLIIDLLVETFYDYNSLKKFCKLREKLIKIDSNINHMIIENIDKFYIKKITI